MDEVVCGCSCVSLVQERVSCWMVNVLMLLSFCISARSLVSNGRSLVHCGSVRSGRFGFGWSVGRTQGGHVESLCQVCWKCSYRHTFCFSLIRDHRTLYCLQFLSSPNQRYGSVSVSARLGDTMPVDECTMIITRWSLTWT